MINVSDEFRTLMQSRTDFKQNAVITTVDGQTIELTDANFTVSNNSVTDAAGANGLPLGSAIARTIQIEVMNDTEFLADVALIGAKIRLYLTFQLSETIEKIEYGTFTVIEPETYGETVIISAIDDMYKADKEYTTGLAFPQTAGAVFRDACQLCGITIGSSDFPNADYIIQKTPEGKTCREIIGYVAQIAGGNARIDRFGFARIITYDLSEIEVSENVSTSGGTFSPWTSGAVLSGGTFSPWTTAEVLSGGTFVPWTSSGSGSGGALIPDGVHELRRWINLRIDTDDIVITGIQTIKRVEDEEGNVTESTIMYGSDGYVLVIDNPLIEGNEEAAIQGIGDILIGGRIRKFSGDHTAYPLAEFGDKAVIFDRKGNWYQTILTDINFQFFGMTNLSNSAADALRNSSKYNSAAADVLIAAKQMVKREKTQRELMAEKLDEIAQNSSGLYQTEEEQGDGSVIYYFHDKPTIEESQNVIKFTAEAIAVSNDGGETYPFGFTLNGEMVMSIIAAEGLSASWITTGSLVAKDSRGKTVFQIDVNTGRFVVNSKNFQLDADGNMTAVNGNFSGEINSDSGTIGGFTIDATRLYSDAHTNPGGNWVPGVVLDNGNGVISVGDGVFKSNATGQARIGLTNYYVIFNNGNSYPIEFEGNSYFRDAVRFAGSVVFEDMPTFPEPIALKSYPVGSIFMTFSNDDPADLLGGGSWLKLEGAFLLAANSTYPVGSEGGSATHALTENELAPHRHKIGTYAGGVGESGTAVQRGWGGSTTWNDTAQTQQTGSGTPFSIMPPYIAVNMWRRIR